MDINKWKGLPEDEGAVFIRVNATLDKYNVLFEKSSWSGIEYSSIVFANLDIDSESDEQIIDLIKESSFYNPEPNSITINRSKHYTFVCFNFEDMDDDDSFF